MLPPVDVVGSSVSGGGRFRLDVALCSSIDFSAAAAFAAATIFFDVSVFASWAAAFFICCNFFFSAAFFIGVEAGDCGVGGSVPCDRV